MVIQVKVICYDEVESKEEIETCIVCIKKGVDKCFSAAVEKIESYYGKELLGFIEMKILSDNDFLVVRGSHEFFSEGDIVDDY